MLDKIFHSCLIFVYLFLTGSVAGWFLEVFYRKFFGTDNPEHKWVNPGFLVGPYLPIYGCGTVFLFGLSEIMQPHETSGYISFTIVLFITSSIFMTLLELIGGKWLLKNYNLRLWDYSDLKFNYKGYICLRFSIYWGLISVVFYYVIRPLVIMPLLTYISLDYILYITGIMSGFFLNDLWHALDVIKKIKEFAQKTNIVVNYEKAKRQFMDSLEKPKMFAKVQTDNLMNILNQMKEQTLENINEFKEKVDETKDKVLDVIDETKDKIEDIKDIIEDINNQKK